MRLLLFTTAYLFLAQIAPAAAGTPPGALLYGITVAVERPTPGAKTATIQLELTNASEHTITAWSLSLRCQYGDGTEQTVGMTVDAIHTLTKSQTADAFLAGQTRTEPAVVPLNASGNAPDSVDVTVTLVALDNATAAGSLQRIQALEQNRSTDIELTKEILGDLRTVRAAPSPQKAAADRQAATERSGVRGGGRVKLLQMIGRNVDRLPDGRLPQQYVDHWEEYLTVVSANSHLKVIE